MRLIAGPPADELGRILRVSPRFALERVREGAAEDKSDAALLLGEREHYVARRTAAAVLDLLDGERTVGELLDACDGIPPEQVLHALFVLEERGLIDEVQAGEPEELAFLSGLPSGLSGFFGAGAEPSAAVPPVELVSASARDSGAKGSDASETVAAALRGAGFDFAPDGVRVIVAEDYLAPRCLDLALEARNARRASFLVQPSGLRPMIGPYFDAGATPGRPCPRCLTHALDEQRPVERFVERSQPARGRPAIPRGMLPASCAAAAHLAAIELLRLTRQPDSPTRLWTLDFPRFELGEHRVRRRPQCPVCGDPKLQATIGERAVSLTSAAIGFRADGGVRREPPAQSLARLRHLISPVLGPVTHLAPMPERHSEAHPVFSSGYMVAPRSLTSGNPFDRNCAGKGRTVDQARMSALAEAIERTSGVYRGDEALRVASFEELGDEALHPDRLHLFSETQRTAGSAPPWLEPRTPMAWTPAWSLTHDRRRWAPLAYCYTEAPEEHGASYCRPSSNGSAAGNGLEEAILQGLFEAIERDAVAIWWYGRIRRPAVAVPPPVLDGFRSRQAEYAALGWSMWALDVTHDLGVPVIVAVAVHEPSDRLVLGFGAHADPVIALHRAVSELDQVFDPRGSRPSPWDGMAASRLPQLWPDPAARAMSHAPACASDDLRDHVMTWVGRLAERSLETIVVDKTRPDLGLCVAQVIVPGLRHPWPRLAPGRLYTVPVALGWLPHPRTEDQLQPEPLLI